MTTTPQPWVVDLYGTFVWSNPRAFSYSYYETPSLDPWVRRIQEWARYRKGAIYLGWNTNKAVTAPRALKLTILSQHVTPSVDTWGVRGGEIRGEWEWLQLEVPYADAPTAEDAIKQARKALRNRIDGTCQGSYVKLRHR